MSRAIVGKNILGICAETTRWTQIARFCYQRGCNCHDCYYAKFSKSGWRNNKCNVKACVLELVRTKGLAKNIDTPQVMEDN